MGCFLVKEFLLIRDAQGLPASLGACCWVVFGPAHVEEGGRKTHSQVAGGHLWDEEVTDMAVLYLYL